MHVNSRPWQPAQVAYSRPEFLLVCQSIKPATWLAGGKTLESAAWHCARENGGSIWLWHTRQSGGGIVCLRQNASHLRQPAMADLAQVWRHQAHVFLAIDRLHQLLGDARNPEVGRMRELHPNAPAALQVSKSRLTSEWAHGKAGNSSPCATPQRVKSFGPPGGQRNYRKDRSPAGN